MADLPVTLDDLKKHLNIDINDDDDLLLEYEAAAVELAEHFMNREIIQRDDAQALSTTAAGVPAAVKQYIRCQVGDFYKQREITATGQFATFYKIFTNSVKLQQQGSSQRFISTCWIRIALNTGMTRRIKHAQCGNSV